VRFRLVIERQQQLLEAQADGRIAQAEYPLDLLEVAAYLDEDPQELEVLFRQHRELVGREAALDGDAALLALEFRDEQGSARYRAFGGHRQSWHQLTSIVMWARPVPSLLSVSTLRSWP